jgi:hypothetical protein
VAEREITLSVTTDEHMKVLKEANAIYIERNAKYGDNWKNQGTRGNLFKIRWKVERAWRVLWHSENVGAEDVDDLLDVINDCVFAIRCARSNDRDGRWDW